MKAVFWKELADYFGSWRFIIIFFIILLVGIYATYTASQAITGNVGEAPGEFVFLRLFTKTGGGLPSFIWFLSFFGPLIGIIFGFDAINNERSQGTLSRVVSQPLFRDSLINGKFLAGLAAIAITLASILLIISGLGVRLIGVGPSLGELARVGIFYGVSVVYIGFWLSLGILFSVLFNRTATSAFAAVAIWLVFALFISMIAGIVAGRVAPVSRQSGTEQLMKHQSVRNTVMRVSPTYLFEEATQTILKPSTRTLKSMVTRGQTIGMIPAPLALTQSLKLVWPHLTVLVALMAICFGISYVSFMRQEIRA
ncbi:MAG: ABC transporter permease [Candidatus Bipolaricaulia bacterium]